MKEGLGTCFLSFSESILSVSGPSSHPLLRELQGPWAFGGGGAIEQGLPTPQEPLLKTIL